MPLWLLIILLVLAVYRLTRLIVKDTFPPVLWLRDHLVGGWRPLTEAEWRIIRHRESVVGKALGAFSPVPFVMKDVDHGNGPVASRWVDRWRWVPDWLADLLSCPWCASGWVSLVVVAVTCVVVGVPLPILVWLAVWAAGSLIAAQRWA